MKSTVLANTPLPKGYSTEAIVVRRFLLDLRSRLGQLHLERQRKLEATLYEYDDGKRIAAGKGSRIASIAPLVRAVG